MSARHMSSMPNPAYVPDSDDAFRHIMRLVSRYGRERATGGRIDALLGQETTTEQASAQDDRICDALHRVGFAIRWALDENGRGAAGEPHQPGLDTKKTSRSTKVAEEDGHVQ